MSKRSRFKCSLTDEEEGEIRNFFLQCDMDDNGLLDVAELQQMFKNLNVATSMEDIKTIFEKVDGDQDGTVDCFELIEFIREVIAECANNDDIVEAFSLIDEDKNGVVTLEEMADAMEKADVGIPLNDVYCVMDEANIDTNGVLSFSDFTSIMLGL